MTAKKAEPVRTPDPITDHQIAHAYALVPDRERPGNYYAVHLKGVYCDDYEHLEPSKRSSAAVFQLNRIYQAMDKRQQRKAWDK